MDNPLRYFAKLIRGADGYVNPELQLLVAERAVHGMVSLAGVSPDDISLIVPRSLAETRRNIGPWLRFLSSLGYDVTSRRFDEQHQIDGFFPLLGAANHSQNGGRLVERDSHFVLYGCDFSYSTNPDFLRERYGIHEP